MQFSNFLPFVSLRKKPEHFSTKFMEALLQQEATQRYMLILVPGAQPADGAIKVTGMNQRNAVICKINVSL